jgi:hypothetical protein
VIRRAGSRAPGRPTNYRIVVRSELSARYSQAFEGMTLVSENGQTAITGPVIDQAQLHGLLDRIRDLGLELVSVTATPGPAEDPASGSIPPAADA